MIVSPKIFDSERWKKISGPVDSAVILLLLTRADRKTLRAYPAIDRIADDLHTSKRSIMRALNRLETAGILIIVRTQSHYLEKGHNKIRKKNDYDLSTWGEYCIFKKEGKQ